MDRYQRVEKPREETPIIENEIRITAQGRMRSYITYASTLLQEKGSNDIVFKAMGRAINKTVMIVELIKRRIVGLHQITAIGSTDITDTWEPLEEGLLPLETTRHVSMITITLSKTELDKANVGYQFSLPADQVKPWGEFDYEGEAPPALRGRGRGGQGRAREEDDDKAKIVKAIYKIQAQGDDDDEDDAYLIDPIDFNRKLTFNLSRNHDDDVALVAEIGPVALRDFPHPRHLCANFPFNTTSHESYCSQCFCYVCDIAPPCLQWTGTSGHCNVSKKPL